MPFPEVEAPINTRGSTAEDSSGRQKLGEPDPNDLLALASTEPEKVIERMLGEWERSSQQIRSFDAQWKVNLARAEGYLGARVEKVQDRQEAWVPYGAGPSMTGLDRAARLSRRLRSVIFADPPIPDVVPTTGQDTAADNAQFQERILMDESSEGRLGYAVLAADAFEVATDYGSGFVHFYIDPEGRGPEPVQIRAHPDATSAEDPMLEAERVLGQNLTPKAPILRYVTADGRLVDDRYGQPLQQHFLPKLCAMVLSGRHVRFLPGTARDLWDATGVLVGSMVPLGDVKATFPSVAQMSDTEVADLVRYRPTKAAELLPVEQRKYLDTGRLSDSSLVFQLLRYELPTRRNWKGSYLAAIGDHHLAHHGTWWDEEHDEPLDLPLTQFMQYRKFGNPYGAGSREMLGPGGELLALMLEAMLEHMDRFGDQKVFVPTTSSVRPEQLESESHRYIPVSPQGQPVSEQIPDFPVVIEKMYGRVSAEMDDESALGQSGQARQSPSVTSARHFTANLQQVQVLLSDLRQNTARALTRGWRIMGQQIRAFYSIPQLLRWKGEDGAYHLREWYGSDLIGLADIQIAQGSFTQMLPAQKAAMARDLFLTDKVLSADQYKRIVFGQFNPLLAIEEDPHFQRVKRQIDRWLEGPPADVHQSPPLQPQLLGGMPSARDTGIPVGAGAPGAPGQPPQPPPPPPNPFAAQLADIFDVRPADDEPAVAATRMQELGRIIASTKFSHFPEAWQAGIAQAYQAARQAAQVPDAKQTQQVQQQLQETQQQLQEIQAKAEQKPTLSFSVKLAELDPAQSAAVIQQQGIQLPPSSAPVPPASPDPLTVLQMEQERHQAELAADVEKHRSTQAASVEQARIKAGKEAAQEDARGKHAASIASALVQASQAMRPTPAVAPPITIHLPGDKPKRLLYDSQGKIIGSEPVDG